MAAFDYKALTLEGKSCSGVIEADSNRQARQLLREQQLTPLSLVEGRSQSTKTTQREFSSQWFSPKLPTKTLALITRQMATLIQAGLPLEEVLQAIAQQSEQQKVKSLMLAVRGKLLEGHTLADSLAQYPRSFPQLYRATVAAGEHSGHLDKVMLRLADHTEESQQFQQKIQMAMIYPSLLVILSVAMVTGLMVYIVPDVIEVFINNNQQLPPLTAALVAISDFIAAYGWLLLLLPVVVILIIHTALKRPPIKLWLHKQWLHRPVARRFSRGFNTTRYASTLSILTNSGLPLVDAMRISTDVLSNDYLKLQMQQATEHVEEGSSLQHALQQSGYFSPMMLHMIASGEASGELDAMLERTADYQAKDLQNLVTVLVGLFEPAMLLAMGVTVLLIVIAILLPILNMNQLIS